MTSNNSWRVRIAQILLGAAFVIALVVVRGTNAGNEPIHLTTDWSHRHVIFSAPKNLGHHVQLLSNPRYVQQLVRRNAGNHGDPGGWRWHRAPDPGTPLHGDWSLNMGAGATVGAGTYPAKYSFDATTATCAELNGNLLPSPDFVVYNTGLAGSATQPTIVAFTNLYVGTCSTDTIDTPNTYWVYNTGTGGTVVTSPVLSGDGSQVAIIQNNAGASSLVILRWQAFDSAFTSVGAPTPESPANYNNGSGTTCTAPCQVTIAFDTTTTTGCTTAAIDSNSSPFYDYAHDALYVGNDQGCVHKFSPVFNGAPAEITATGTNHWPASVNSGRVLTSPVFDDGTGRVFVASTSRRLYRVDSTIGSGGGGVVASAVLGNNGIDDSPILDSTTGNVYVFVRGDNTLAAGRRAGVYQFTTGFVGGTVNESQVGSNNTLPATAFYDGDFDNIYYSSADGTGSMYVCGNNASRTAIWRIPITAGVPGAAVAGPTLTTANVACSGVTEFNNGAIDRMFLSVTGSAITGTSGGGAAINCPTPSGGCIMSFDITTTTGWGVAKGTSATAAAASGTSGIVVDNSSSADGASQIYFTPLADQPCTTSGDTGGCAIQASQSLLN
jgi:hypothetical protein